jgi:hypothetical protein
MQSATAGEEPPKQALNLEEAREAQEVGGSWIAASLLDRWGLQAGRGPSGGGVFGSDVVQNAQQALQRSYVAAQIVTTGWEGTRDQGHRQAASAFVSHMLASSDPHCTRTAPAGRETRARLRDDRRGGQAHRDGASAGMGMGAARVAARGWTAHGVRRQPTPSPPLKKHAGGEPPPPPAPTKVEGLRALRRGARGVHPPCFQLPCASPPPTGSGARCSRCLVHETPFLCIKTPCVCQCPTAGGPADPHSTQPRCLAPPLSSCCWLSSLPPRCTPRRPSLLDARVPF